ncbi:MAG: Cellulose-binding domain protein [Myxococcaceae bacterium]|nr:Cellulose-binding domain protein [Myxococcaceae bacterium]
MDCERAADAAGRPGDDDNATAELSHAWVIARNGATFEPDEVCNPWRMFAFRSRRDLRVRLTVRALVLLGFSLLSACQAAASAQAGGKAPENKGSSVARPESRTPPALPRPPVTKSARARPATAAPPAPAGPSTRANETSPLGTNLDAINDWSSSWPFVDAMKRSRDWISSPEDQWDDKRKIALDEQGYPRSLQKGQRARTLIFWEAKHYPAGDYAVIYKGSGSLAYDPQSDVRSRKPGREVIHLDPKKGDVSLLISAVPTPANYLRELHVIAPGGVCVNDPVRYCDAKQPCAGNASCTLFETNHEAQIFHPTFLERIQRFGVVRFMDWMKTNESKEHKWADRPLPSDVRYVHGAPLEVMVALANRLSQHPWFNIPHAADDDYVRRFATYVRDNLKPGLKAYVEYSNEVWNGIFPQAGYAVEQGKKLGFGKSDWEAQYRFHAHRSTQVHKIWESVFKGQRERIVRVLGTQCANEGVAEALLSFEDTKDHVDALAVAPYFGGEYTDSKEVSKWENATVTQIIDDLRARSLPTAFKYTKTHAEIAAKYKLELVAYEGGESFAGFGGAENNEKLNKLFDAVGRDPRIKQIYLEYLEGWKRNGGKLFVHFTDVFTPGKWGRWGALEYLDQPRAQAPKFDGIMTFIENNPRWW